ncbi:hypothetical protein F2Q69_00027488 [Brassica cretica]|uniref:Uncharacterized protein n=1 Tax=Brassica cretica TaxID=69181 RepID=A0A8S9RXI2_BRACR|nr:hypothetical protein F2Q69_00027488 [Brassica cretica]
MKRLSFPPTRLRFNGALNHSESSGSRGSGNSALDEASIRQELHDLSSCCSCCHSEFKKDIGPLHPGGFYLACEQGPTPSTAFGNRMGSSPPPDVEPVSMTIGPQDPYQQNHLEWKTVYIQEKASSLKQEITKKNVHVKELNEKF